MTRGERQALAAVLLLAGALRVAACVYWRGDLDRDPDAYHGLAEGLASGEGYVAPDGRPTAFRPPLYPLMLAGVIWAGPAGVAAVQVALGVGTAGLTASLGRRLGLGRWSLLAAGLVAVDPLLLRYTPQVMTEVTCAFLAALVLWLGTGERPVLTGVAFGLAVLSRPTFWVFGGLAAGWWVWRRVARPKPEGRGPDRTTPGVISLDRTRGLRGHGHAPLGPATRAEGCSAASIPRALDAGPRPSGSGGGWRVVRHAALTLLGIAAVVSPWAFRNAFVMGRPLLTTTHGGYTLLLANNPVFWGEVVEGPPGAVWGGASLAAWQGSLEAEMAAEGVSPGEVARDRWMGDRGVRHIRERPASFLKSVSYRVRRLWDVTPAAGEVPRVARWGVGMFSATTFALAAAGVGRLLWGRGRGRRVGEGDRCRAASWPAALLLIAAFTAVHAVYWTDARMRAPLVPAVALFAAFGVAGSRGRPNSAET